LVGGKSAPEETRSTIGGLASFVEKIEGVAFKLKVELKCLVKPVKVD
jgi:hypothetical protein